MTTNPAIPSPRHRAEGDASLIAKLTMTRPSPRHRAPGWADRGYPMPTRRSLVRVDGAATAPIPLRTAQTTRLPVVDAVVPFGAPTTPEVK